MNVGLALTAVSYALVGAAFLPVAVSGEIGLASPVAFLLAMAGSLLRDPRTAPPRPITAKLWTGGLLLTAAVLLTWSWRDSNWLLHALQFALLLTVSRFFQRRFAKDFLQLMALSFVLLLVGAIISPGPIFAGAFLVYTVLTMWGLTLLHLTREIEVHTHTGPEHLTPDPPDKRRWFGLRKPLPPQPPSPWTEATSEENALAWRTRRLLTKRFLAALSGMAVGVLVISALFFFLFPRIGIGLLFAQTRGHSVTGFGLDAQLGNFGQIKSSPEVIARVSFPNDPERMQQSVRLRGASFENFVGNGWTRPHADPMDLLLDPNGRYIVPWAGQVNTETERTFLVDVYLEPLGQDVKVLFAPPRTRAVQILDASFDMFRGRSRRVRGSEAGDLTYRVRNALLKTQPDLALHYAVEAIEPISEGKEIAALQAADAEPAEDIAERWLVLPKNLDTRIPPLAKRLVGKATTRYDKASLLQEALRTGWTYSLDGDQDAKAPLADFLFGKKRGHCEYFATSMALMLRTQGIPARVVHGFSGGVYNPYGGYRMIRQADAHSWVEVYFEGVGWRTFDPTPASGQVAEEESGITASLRQLADGAAMLWYQWIVEYDLEQQVSVLKGLGNMLPSGTGLAKFGVHTDSPRRSEQVKAQVTNFLLAAGVLTLLASVVYGIWWQWQRRSQHKTWDRGIQRAENALQRQLQRVDQGRAPWETWSAVATRLHAVDAQVSAAIAVFAQAYDRARYAPAPDADTRAEAKSRAQAATAEARKLRKS